jgi:hypothetical protein
MYKSKVVLRFIKIKATNAYFYTRVVEIAKCFSTLLLLQKCLVSRWEMDTQAHFLLHAHILFLNSLLSEKCVTSQPVALYEKVIVICPCKTIYFLCCIAWSYLGKWIKAPQCFCFILRFLTKCKRKHLWEIFAPQDDNGIQPFRMVKSGRWKTGFWSICKTPIHQIAVCNSVSLVDILHVHYATFSNG